MTSRSGWALKNIIHITVNNHSWALLTPVKMLTHTHICRHSSEDIMIKVHDLGVQINAIVLMASRKYYIQTDYYNSRLGTVTAPNDHSDKWVGKSTVILCAYLHLSLSFSLPFSCFLPHLVLTIRDSLITNCWHITWVIAKGVWALKQPHQRTGSFIMMTRKVVTHQIKYGSLCVHVYVCLIKMQRRLAETSNINQ